MVAIDTNVLVRILVNDDTDQAARARRWMARHQEEGILVDHIVLVELVWVLRARYRVERTAIVRALEALLDGASLVIPDEMLVREAVTRYAAGRGDFADHLIRARAESRGASPLATLDEELFGLRGFTKV